jgi:hypothetical protein
MAGKTKPKPNARPAHHSTTAESDARHAFEDILVWCRQGDDTFALFEKSLWTKMLALAGLLVRLFLVVAHEKLKRQAETPSPGYRLGKRNAKRTIKTLFGLVCYVRTHWISIAGGNGHYPLDAKLGLTRDGFSLGVVSLVTRLTTRMSFGASRRLCRSILGWAPSNDSIEQLVLGLGRQAAPFVLQQEPPKDDGEVLVIEVDGKCPPTATDAELRKRRGQRRQPKTAGGYSCTRPQADGRACLCQRHRGQQKRKQRGSKKRRKKGDKSKNGKEVTLVVMYTLKRGEDGRLHGPLNKKVWGSFGGRKRAAQWARREATKRGFGPQTEKTVQVVVDGAGGLKSNLEALFPKAIFTVDVCHVVEKLWALGHRFHAEGSEQLKAQVSEWKELVYAGRAEELLVRLRKLQDEVPQNGPGTKGKRGALKHVIGYVEKRVDMMQYGQWRKQDLVIASGQVEGAVRQVVGERLDCAGMRWIVGRAEAVLQLRCIELNGDWDKFIDWAQQQYHTRLLDRQAVLVRSNEPLKCDFGLAF